MNFKSIGISIICLFFSAYNLIYTPLSFVSYWLGISLAVISIVMFIDGIKGRKEKSKKNS
tara:strand:+ start:2015 stop:2194 length:180 start_codon:yes stop_codon:yes gene_type:complete